MDENTNNARENAAGEETMVNGAGQADVRETAGQEAGTAKEGSAAGIRETGQDTTKDPAGSQEKDAARKEQEAGKKAEGEEKLSEAETSPDKSTQGSREEEIRKREESLARRELELDTKAILKEKGISEAMLPYLIRENREETEKCIDAYKAAADAELKARLDERLVGKTPPQSAGQVTKGDKTISDVFASALRG